MPIIVDPRTNCEVALAKTSADIAAGIMPDDDWGPEHPCVTEVLALERVLLETIHSANRTKQENLIAYDFTYITPFGAALDREQTLHRISSIHCDPREKMITIHPLTGQILGDDFVLVAYITDSSQGRISRASLWRKSLRSWQIVFHQGSLWQAAV